MLLDVVLLDVVVELVELELEEVVQEVDDDVEVEVE